MKGERTCDFRASHDPATLKPLGPACGKPATQELYWADGRFSLGCATHGLPALDKDARALVARVVQLSKPTPKRSRRGR